MIGGSDRASELASIKPWAKPAAVITAEQRAMRIELARKAMVDAGVDALLVPAGPSLVYFTGLGWGMIERLIALVVPRSGKPVLVCPAFERGSLEAVLKMDADVRLWKEDEDPYRLIASTLRETGGARLAVDPALPFGMSERLRGIAPSSTLVDAGPIIEGCRSLKSAEEIALLRQAMAMTLEVQRRAARVLAPGIRASEVAAFIDEAHRRLGSAGSTFCLVQFGASTAFPHGLPSDDVLREGDMVLIDTGCSVDGYNSDVTRSYVVGQPNPDQRRVWNIEREAQQAAFDAVRPGVTCHEVDAAARRVLSRHALGPGFALPGMPHRTGHGIGLAIHEAPYLVLGDRTVLLPGMCCSDEPTIVLPGAFGVRLEDHFHVGETGACWFTEPAPSVDRPFA